MTGLQLAPKLTLPVDVAGEAIAILAKRGAGKTNTGRVLVEELHQADVQTVVLDPVGAWWGLRSSADGKKPGLPLPVLGGAHGDVPLEATAGRLLADVVVDNGQSLVIDLSDFSKTQQRQFVTEFGERLYTRKARERQLLHLVLEEADEFVPQVVRGADARMVGAIEQLVRRGRGRGIGLTMITQRSASLNKAVLEQADVLIVMRTTGPRDRAAIAAWVEKQDVEGADDVLPSLGQLDTGEAWIWNPERALLQRVQIRIARTFDSSSTPKAGETRATPKQVAPIDLTALGAEIAATAERAKATDPKELQKQIRELERQLAERPAETTTVEVERVVEIPVVTDEAMERLVATIAPAADAAAAIRAHLDELAQLYHQLSEISTSGAGEGLRKPAPQPAPAPSPPTRPAPPPRREPVAPADGVSGPQQRILNALAALEQIGVRAPVKVQLALFAEASPKSSSFSNNLGHLNNQLGLITYPAAGRVALTDAGRAIADAGGAPSSTAELHAYVAQLVGPAKWRLLEQLIAYYDAPLEKTQLAEAAGVSASSSSFSNNLGSLRTLGLIDYPAPGEVVALPVLFMEGT